MKNLGIIFGLLMFSSLAVAGNGIERYVNIRFEDAAEMSGRAQLKLEEVINKKCQPAATTASGLSAKLVNLERIRVDQGIVDEIYTVKVVFHGWEQYEHEVATIKMTDYAGQNPGVEWVQVESIETSLEGLCK